MKKPQVVFSFRCTHKPESVLERLREQIELLEDREYLLNELDDGFELGIGRGGHGAGYWYCARVCEDGSSSLITGSVLHRHYSGRVSDDRDLNLWDHLAIFLLLIIFFQSLLARGLSKEYIQRQQWRSNLLSL